MDLAIASTYALAMARHPRLGAESPASVLSSDCLQHIAQLVSDAHKELLCSRRRVVLVRVRTSDYIYTLEFVFSDGSTERWGNHYGNHHPVNPKVWHEEALGVGEYLVEIAGIRNGEKEFMTGGDYLTNLRLRTNLNRAISFDAIDRPSEKKFGMPRQRAEENKEITGFIFDELFKQNMALYRAEALPRIIRRPIEQHPVNDPLMNRIIENSPRLSAEKLAQVTEAGTSVVAREVAAMVLVA